MELMKLTDLKSIISSTFDKALEIQYPLAIKNVERLRRVHPTKSPKELLAYLDEHYLRTVAITGFATGTAAAVPNGVVQMPVAQRTFSVLWKLLCFMRYALWRYMV